jgi:hypothetical protein
MHYCRPHAVPRSLPCAEKHAGKLFALIVVYDTDIELARIAIK